MSSSESVAIHIRKGNDYKSTGFFAKTCSPDYYREAIDYVSSKVKNPEFFIFTDNPDWVKENLSGIDYKLVEGNPLDGPGNHLDMQLMSSCKHIITANSSYSWWGAYLNRNPDKIVVMPKLWFFPSMGEEENSHHLQCKGWIAL